MLFAWVAGAVAAPLDAAATRAFLDWHCSADNVWRYDGKLTLAQAPLQPPYDGGDPGLLLEVDAYGHAVGNARDFVSIAVAADAPVEQVATVFWKVAPLVERPVHLLLAAPDNLAPRPEPPLAEDVLARVHATEEVLRRDPEAADIRDNLLWLATRRCPAAAEKLRTGPCAEAASQLAGDLIAGRCGDDPAGVLAAWTLSFQRGDGVPVVRVPIRARGADLLTGEGTWGTSAPAFLAEPEPALAGTKPPIVGGMLGGGVINGAHMFHYSDLEVKERVVPEYPAEALAMKLGDQRCLVKVFIDEQGVPYEAYVDTCPKVFHETVRDAVLSWRWYPPKDGRTAVKAWTTLPIRMEQPE